MSNFLLGNEVENMCPENARVFVVEDSTEWQKIIKKTLEDGGHLVVANATTRQGALTIIPHLSDFGVEVAAIDGNLSIIDSSGDDGQLILNAIRRLAPGVRTVGISAIGVPGADVNVQKRIIETHLAKAVTDL